jgi:hypothetical protein
MIGKRWVGAAAGTLLAVAASVPRARAQDQLKEQSGIRHVLLISVDGMHALDYLNCSKGIAGANGGQPYCPNLAELGTTGINYLETSTPVFFPLAFPTLSTCAASSEADQRVLARLAPIRASFHTNTMSHSPFCNVVRLVSPPAPSFHSFQS